MSSVQEKFLQHRFNRRYIRVYHRWRTTAAAPAARGREGSSKELAIAGAGLGGAAGLIDGLEVEAGGQFILVGVGE